MTKANTGHFGVTFLRPAFEELVWLDYLRANMPMTKDLPLLMVRHEISDSLSAQNEYMGARTMHEGGFTQRFVKVNLALDRVTQAQIREIGRKLGWNTSRNLLPSMQFLTRKVGRERDYKFLYHATSRYVHFSGAEIFRRIWGKHGKVDIGSNTFSDYWTTFALTWGFRTFLEVLICCGDLIDSRALHDEAAEKILSLIASFLRVPIITQDELRSWDESADPGRH
jgi:hypothetical protein